MKRSELNLGYTNSWKFDLNGPKIIDINTPIYTRVSLINPFASSIYSLFKIFYFESDTKKSYGSWSHQSRGAHVDESKFHLSGPWGKESMNILVPLEQVLTDSEGTALTSTFDDQIRRMLPEWFKLVSKLRLLAKSSLVEG